jgi:hypothetical protein
VINLLIALLPLIAPALRWADNPNRSYWRVDLLVYALVVWVMDMVLAHLFFRPRSNEWTISHTLERTVFQSADSMRLARAINAISPGHIKVIL